MVIERMPGPKLRAAIAAAHRVFMAHVDNAILHGRGTWKFTEMQKAADEGDRSARIYMDALKYERTLSNELERRRAYHGKDTPINRKENPMATARKKPATAAQLRARAAFTKVMKSGGFGAKRKTRKKNPVGRSGASGRDSAVSKLDYNRQQRALSGRAKPRRKNPVGRSRSGKSPWATNVGFPDFTKQSRALSGRKRNPTKPVLAYVVHAARHGVKGAAVGSFPTKPAAVQYAKAWVKLHDCPAMISGRGAR